MAMKFTASLRNNETGEVEIFEGDEAVLVMMCDNPDDPSRGVGIGAIHSNPLTFAQWLNANDFGRAAATIANLTRDLDPILDMLSDMQDDEEGAKP